MPSSFAVMPPKNWKIKGTFSLALFWGGIFFFSISLTIKLRTAEMCGFSMRFKTNIISIRQKAQKILTKWLYDTSIPPPNPRNSQTDYTSVPDQRIAFFAVQVYKVLLFTKFFAFYMVYKKNALMPNQSAFMPSKFWFCKGTFCLPSLRSNGRPANCITG